MPAGGIPFGHFVLHRRIARGGMAEVFLARQRGLEGFDRRVAVKRILPHLSERADFVKMFLDEARLAARLAHPNIVHIYEFGKVDQDYFIAMEYVDGVHAGNLTKHAADEPLPPVLVARIGADAASALAYAHRLEDADGRPVPVVHRDISPQNLMVSFDGVVKLVDFGIAKAVASAGDRTQPGVVKGKYAYMSPEQTMGKGLDGRSDVFSLGLVLWELLAGRHVVSRGDPADGMRVIRDGRFPPIEQVRRDVPAPLAAAIGHALSVDREDRSTAGELGSALEAYIKSAPDLATAMHVADWIRGRFARTNTTGSQQAIDDPRARQQGTQVAPATGASASATPPVTRATAGSSPAIELRTADAVLRTPAEPGLALALPPREATILDTAALGELIEDGTTDHTADDATMLVAPTRPVHAPRRRSIWPWIGIGAIPLVAAAWLLMRGGGGTTTSPRAPDARVVARVTIDAGLSVTAIPPDASGAPIDAEVALASIDVITTPPGAKVRIDGAASTQRAPASFKDLSPGDVEVIVELDGYEPVTRALTLGPGERRTLELGLTRKKSAPDRDPRPHPKAKGTLNVRTTPYSIVSNGGKRLGETPFVIELEAGSYTLTFTNPTKATVKRKVTIRAGEVTKLKFDL